MSVGSLWLCCLIWFLCSIRSIMCCGSSSLLFLSFPCGMLCLSDVSIKFVSIL